VRYLLADGDSMRPQVFHKLLLRLWVVCDEPKYERKQSLVLRSAQLAVFFAGLPKQNLSPSRVKFSYALRISIGMFQKIVRRIDTLPKFANFFWREQAVKVVFDHRVTTMMLIDVANYPIGRDHEGVNRDLVSIVEVKLDSGLQLPPSGLKFRQLHSRPNLYKSLCSTFGLVRPGKFPFLGCFAFAAAFFA
jgi:hypothetical protein